MDRPGGGSSKQPYIQKDIPDGDSASLFSTGGPDFLLRGGLMAPIKAFDDTSRLFKMFIDLKSPKGLLFTLKENLLSRTAVKTEASYGIGYAGATAPNFMTGKGGGAINAGVYTPLGTLGQSLAGFAGVHLNLLGLDPTSPMSGVVEGGLFPGAGLQRYEDIAKVNNQADSNSFPETKETKTLVPNPLAGKPNLSSVFDSNATVPPFIEEIAFETTGGFANRLAQIWYNKQLNTDSSPNVIEYDGGPGSILGIGKTQIKFADQRTGKRNPYAVSDPGFFYGTNHRDKYFLSPESKDISTKLKGVTNFASQFLPSEENREEIVGFENPNRILEKYYALDRSTTELNTNNPVTGVNYDEVISLKGVSNTYNNLIEPIEGGSTLDNDYTNKNFFNVYDPNTTPGNTWPTNTPLQSANGSSTYTQEELIQTTPVSKGGDLQDFRKTLLEGEESSTIMSLAPDYKTKNIENRVNLGNPGSSVDASGAPKNRLKYSVTGSVLDTINGSNIRSGTIANVHSGDYNDLVKFSIGKVFFSDSTKSNWMNFRAFIDSFEDQYSAEWGDIQYVGRGDKFYNYKGFNRTINMSWTVYAQSKGELIPMYKKLNYLAGSLAGDYNSGFLRGSLHRLTVGGYLYNQLGIIKGLTYSVPTESSWEIGINEEGGSDTTVKELPFMIKVTGFQFIPIHDFVPKTPRFDSETRAQVQRYIALSDGGNNNYDS